jgi:hypothetical protein
LPEAEDPGDVGLGSIRSFCHIFRMSGLPPIASEVATTEFSRRERIPSVVGYAFNFDQAGHARKFRDVPTAVICRAIARTMAQIYFGLSVGAAKSDDRAASHGFHSAYRTAAALIWRARILASLSMLAYRKDISPSQAGTSLARYGKQTSIHYFSKFLPIDAYPKPKEGEH